MEAKNVKIGGITIGKGNSLVLIAGPCVIESVESAFEHARKIKEIADKLGVPFIFKSSYRNNNKFTLQYFFCKVHHILTWLNRLLFHARHKIERHK